jgi:hypothetical protein
LRDLPRFNFFVLVVFVVLIVVVVVAFPEIIFVIEIIIEVVIKLEARCCGRGVERDCQNHEVVSAGFTFSRFGGGYVVQK